MPLSKAQMRVVLWPSQDGRRVGNVFRTEQDRVQQDRVLVLIGPVVPRRSCTPSMLSQLTLITIKPLVCALEAAKNMPPLPHEEVLVAKAPANCVVPRAIIGAPRAKRPAPHNMLHPPLQRNSKRLALPPPGVCVYICMCVHHMI